jgi:putative ABC transport system permease protein
MILLGISIAGSPGDSSNNLGGVQVGDTVRLTYPNNIQKEYIVKGVFQTREMSADRMAFVTRDEMIAILGGQAFTDRANQILVKFSPAFSEKIVLADLRSLDINGAVKSWQEYGGSVGSVVSSFDMIASLISAISLVVVAIVMFIVIYINVVNRKRQIGILRAIGINRRIILYSYLFQAIFYAVIGMTVGGLLFQFGIRPYFDLNPINLPIGQVRLSVNPVTVGIGVLGIIAAAVFAGIIPALTITRQTIIKSIWGV